MGSENLRKDLPLFVFGLLTAVPLTSASRSQALAVGEFSSKGFEVQGRRTLPVGVACDVLDPASDIDRNVDHLVDTLNVPAIISGVDAFELAHSFERVHEDKGKDVFFLDEFESNSVLTPVRDDGLLWHMLPSPVDVARTFVPLVKRAEAYVRKERKLDASEPVRVALIEASDPVSADIGAFLDRELTVNGKLARENTSGTYLRLKIASSQLDRLSSTGDEFQLLYDFNPDVIVALAASEFVDSMMWPLEKNLLGTQAPFYVLSPAVFNASMLFQLVADIPGLEQRIVGVNTAAADDPTLYQALLRNLDSEYPGMGGEGSENFYDAVYFVLYAASAAGRVPVLTGKDIARGMGRLLDGPRYDMGVSQISNLSNYLQTEDTTLSLYGTMGPPSFNPGTGARNGVGSVWCMTVPAPETSSSWPQVRFDELRFDPESESLSGQLSCIEGF
jgi:hypothetical protein